MLRSIYLLSFFLLQSLFAFAGNVKEDVPSTFDLYVCIGQSNMAGRATLTPEVMDTLQNVYLLNDKGNFEPAVNPLNRYSTVRKDLSMQRLGPAYGFAKEMARQTKRPVGLVDPACPDLPASLSPKKSVSVYTLPDSNNRLLPDAKGLLSKHLPASLQSEPGKELLHNIRLYSLLARS